MPVIFWLWPDIKGFMTDVKPALLSALDAEYEKYPYEVPYITAALAESKLGAEGRKDLFDWLTRHLSKANDLSDASPLLKPTATALTAAECCLGEVLRVCGQEAVCELCINYF
ncbi:hypothetical protein B296_00027906 [Ensete ventricosum]|uniref:Uncharacterized protein n=1 Tax=Ensete ventricosum TaxID=4639 RepID=A0A426ZR41_ENSVE|nr:hypothetical protein B296_00027906 [Ensete ventricosum]